MVDSSSFFSLVLYLFIFFVNDRACVRVYDSILCSRRRPPLLLILCSFFSSCVLLLSLSLSLTNFSLLLLTFFLSKHVLGFRGLGAKKNRKKNFGEKSRQKEKEKTMTDTARPPPSATTTMNNNNNDPIIASTTSAPGPDDVVAVAALIDELKVRLLSFFLYIYFFSF